MHSYFSIVRTLKNYADRTVYSYIQPGPEALQFCTIWCTALLPQPSIENTTVCDLHCNRSLQRSLQSVATTTAPCIFTTCIVAATSLYYEPVITTQTRICHSTSFAFTPLSSYIVILYLVPFLRHFTFNNVMRRLLLNFGLRITQDQRKLDSTDRIRVPISVPQ